MFAFMDKLQLYFKLFNFCSTYGSGNLCDDKNLVAMYQNTCVIAVKNTNNVDNPILSPKFARTSYCLHLTVYQLCCIAPVIINKLIPSTLANSSSPKTSSTDKIVVPISVFYYE